MPGHGSAYEGLGPSAAARRAAAALLVVLTLVASVLGVAAPAHAAATTITGTMTGPEGPAAGVAVTLRGPTGTTVLTDAAGRYTVPVLPNYGYQVCWGSEYGTLPGERRYLSGCSSSWVQVPPDGSVTFDKRLRVGGILTGHVTGADGGGGLQDVRVEARRRVGGGADDFSRVGATRTDGSGDYWLTLPPATYRIEFTDALRRGYQREYFEDVTDFASAVDVPVGYGDTVTADAELARGSGITGTVTPSAGRADRERAVAVIDAATGEVVRRASLQRDNTYAVWNLAAGTYKVAFNRLSGSAEDAAEFYDERAESAGLAGASVVTVSAASTTSGIDATLNAGGRLEGTIVDGSGALLKRCDVQAYTTDGSLVTRTARTDRDGAFAIGGLASGRYYLRVLSPRRTVSDCDGGRQWLTGTGGALAQTFDDATPVAITQGTTTTLTGDLVYERGGRITGIVTMPAGPYDVDRAVVVRSNASDKVVGVARVRDDGTYSVGGIAVGSYRVTFARVSGIALSEAEFYDNEPELRGKGSSAHVDLTTHGEVKAGMDAALVAGGSISGTLRRTGGASAVGCYVQAYDPTRARVTRAAYTGTDGSFRVGGLTGGVYRLRVIGQRSNAAACRGVTQFYAGPDGLVTDGAAATSITVVRGDETQLSSTLVFATGGSVSGQVTLAPGTGRRLDRTVVVRDTATGAARRARVGRDGRWTVAGLAGGSYRVTFNRLSGPAFAAAQFFDGTTEADGVAAATPVTLAAGEVVTGVDATLVEGAHLMGVLLDDNGDPLTCLVQAVDPTRRLVTRSTFSESYNGGRFDIGGLASGSYRVRVVGGSQCFGGTQLLTDAAGGDLGADPASATLVTLTQGGTSAIADPLVYADAPLPAVLNRTAPTVSGSPQVGATLTAGGGTWRPGSVALAYQWYAGAAPISAATGPTYVPVAADVGQPISVRVTASRSGYTSTTLPSGATTPVSGPGVTPTPPVTAPSAPLAFALDDKPAVKGAVKGEAPVGKKLKADAGEVSPAASTVRYQWLLNGKRIKKATRSSFRLPEKYAGKRVSVRITYVRAGYADLEVTSKAVRVQPTGR